MAHDVVIANGVVVDGTGAPRRQADVAIDGDRITIDATGKVVTPGFVDLHSHFDAVEKVLVAHRRAGAGPSVRAHRVSRCDRWVSRRGMNEETT